MRNQIARHGDVTRQSVARKGVELGLRRYTGPNSRRPAPAASASTSASSGSPASRPTSRPELARDAIASIEVMGSLQATPAVKAALADRLL